MVGDDALREHGLPVALEQPNHQLRSEVQTLLSGPGSASEEPREAAKGGGRNVRVTTLSAAREVGLGAVGLVVDPYIVKKAVNGGVNQIFTKQCDKEFEVTIGFRKFSIPLFFPENVFCGLNTD